MKEVNPHVKLVVIADKTVCDLLLKEIMGTTVDLFSHDTLNSLHLSSKS